MEPGRTTGGGNRQKGALSMLILASWLRAMGRYLASLVRQHCVSLPTNPNSNTAPGLGMERTRLCLPMHMAVPQMWLTLMRARTALFGY